MATNPIDSQPPRGLRVVDAAQPPELPLPRARGATVALVHLALEYADARAVYWIQRLAPFGKHAITDEHMRATAQIIAERAAAGRATDTMILYDELLQRGRAGTDDPLGFYAPTINDVVGQTASAELLGADEYAQQIIQAAKSRTMLELAGDAASIALRNEPGEADTYATQVQNALRAWDDLLADATGGSPFKPRKLSELLARGRPALIDTEMRLKEHQIAVVFAQSNVGKSLYVIWRLCAHASAGRNVVYITGEGQYEIGARIMAAIIAHGLDADMVEEHLRIVERTPQLLNPAEVAAAIEQIKDAFDNDEPITLIALDTLSTAIPGQNQNASEVMTAAARGMRELVDAFGCAGILTHHSGKDISKGELGSVHLRGTVDISIELTREDGSDVMVAHGRKSRDGEKEWREAYSVTTQALDEQADNISATVMPGAELPAITSGSGKLQASDRQALDILQTLASGMRYGAWVTEIMRIAGVSDRTAKRTIARLDKAEIVGKDADEMYHVIAQLPC